ncbi:hypothetical protein DCW30_30045 [Streptomyces alfalfae]|uniref:DUF2505 domain-containing protein n=1 Tax=Streptomyces alfalfae TaxID=1642299 RepID=A0ABM6GT70_9ACTN|nr:hypothetical protein [Streptomyces alfalfae]APY86967.1 hypothetical protein A7J05_15585 [Streptomyces alfalfae]AYA17357.1 hypothetical protein D3X13_14870 [Streptomyces fradiae]RXX37135.1 hypothetical protein DCW30_30045 [Streptomyces alfalfae]RZM87389.1 hypothetical protein D4104_27730 [Streptomyces alfalfae]
MTEFEFELTPFFHKARRGRQGVVGAFGDVTVEAEYRKRSIKTASRQLDVRMQGERLPGAIYRTIGPGRPTLRNATLAVDGQAVRLDFNARGIRNAARALRLTYQDRSYEYAVTGFDKGAVLRGPGTVVSLTRRKSGTGPGMSTVGAVTGEADPIGIALAILFEEVDTIELTTSGAASHALNRILNPRANETPSE